MTVSAALNDAGIKLSSYGVGNWKSTCPRCSHTRKKKRDPCLSITIAEDHALAHCHNCQWGERINDPDSRPQERPRARRRRDQGDSPPKDPFRPSAKPVAPRRPSFTPGSLPKGALEWFERRGISQATLERNQVTVRKVWFPQTKDERTAFCFPYYRDGELVNVKYRGKSDEGDKLFRQEKNAEKILLRARRSRPTTRNAYNSRRRDRHVLSLNDDWICGRYYQSLMELPRNLFKTTQPMILIGTPSSHISGTARNILTEPSGSSSRWMVTNQDGHWNTNSQDE